MVSVTLWHSIALIKKHDLIFSWYKLSKIPTACNRYHSIFCVKVTYWIVAGQLKNMLQCLVAQLLIVTAFSYVWGRFEVLSHMVFNANQSTKEGGISFKGRLKLSFNLKEVKFCASWINANPLMALKWTKFAFNLLLDFVVVIIFILWSS